MPPEPDLVFADEHVVSESVTSLPNIAKSKVKTSKTKIKNVSAQIIKDWLSNSKDEDEIKTKTKTKQIKPSFAKVKFVKPTKHVKSPRKSVKQEESNRQTKYPKKNSKSHRALTNSGLKTLSTPRQTSSRAAVSVNTARLINAAYPRSTANGARPALNGNPQQELQEKGVINSGFSRHITRNTSYLSEYEGIDGGYVSFGGIENLIDHKVKIIRCDNRPEFKNKEMNQFCEMKGIRREFSVARTPKQNGVVKRKNKTLIEAARTMLADSKLPTTF
nr:putative ribonuclease H-like domain-containing protein [Tanacetum cinerariifolium]